MDKIKNKAAAIGLIGVLGVSGIGAGGCELALIPLQAYHENKATQCFREHYKNTIIYYAGEPPHALYLYVDKDGNTNFDIKKEKDGRFSYKKSGETYYLDPVKDNIEIIAHKKSKCDMIF